MFQSYQGGVAVTLRMLALAASAYIALQAIGAIYLLVDAVHLLSQ